MADRNCVLALKSVATRLRTVGKHRVSAFFFGIALASTPLGANENVPYRLLAGEERRAFRYSNDLGKPPLETIDVVFSVYFRRNDSGLERKDVAGISLFMLNWKEKCSRTLVKGFADVRGSQDVNRLLARDRARTVIQVLDAVGSGHRAELLAVGAIAADRYANARRVDVIMMDCVER